MLLLWIIYVISVMFLLCFPTRLFIDILWSPAGKGLTSWLLFVVSQVRIQRGDRGSGPPPPPGKSHVICLSIGNKQLDPSGKSLTPPPWKMLDPLRNEVFFALWSPAGKGLTSVLSVVVSNCKLLTFPLVSWVRCGT